MANPKSVSDKSLRPDDKRRRPTCRLLSGALVELQPRQRSGDAELARSIRHLNQQPPVVLKGAATQEKLATSGHLQVGESQPRPGSCPCEGVAAGHGLELIEWFILERLSV